MACRREIILSWTFSSLVAAFLDLALAYLALCGATLAFLAAKFLSFFSLHLPCPCTNNNGLFGSPNANNNITTTTPRRCLHGFLADFPPRQVAAVNFTVRSRFPFDSVFAEAAGEDCRFLESCGSVSNVNKGKGVLLGPRQRLGLRRRRRAAVEQRGLSSSSSPVSSCDPLPLSRLPPPELDWQEEQHSPYSICEQERENSGEDSTPSDSVKHEMPGDFDLVEGTTPEIELNWQLSRCNGAGENTLSGAPGTEELDESNLDAIRILEQAQAAQSALYVELEKERSAAATAADEAMAMILRLQKEKASIEMEARQYQRMVEEKAAYDEEEMNILKEIIVRHEREKHVLDKEVEMYRQMMLSEEMNGHQSADELNHMVHMIGQKPCSSMTFTEDHVQMATQICESVRTKETMSGDNGQPEFIVEKQVSSGGYDNELPSLGLVEVTCSPKPVNIERAQSFDKNHPEVPDEADQFNLDFQEKGMLSIDAYPSSHQSQISRFGDCSGLFDGPQGHNFHNIYSVSVRKGDGENDCRTEVRYPCDGADWETHEDVGERGCESCASKLETESSVLDVHVIDDKLCREGNGKESGSQVGGASASSRIDDIPFEAYRSRSFDVSSSHSSTSWMEAELKTHRSSSSTDFSRVHPPLDGSHDKALLSDLRRSSMSAIDNERLKLETEVEFLRERLKVVQQSREKLNFSKEHKENENFQFQLLGEIASQLREIRLLTEPGRTIRQVSLPPLSSKVNSKKRRCRSVSWGIHGST